MKPTPVPDEVWVQGTGYSEDLDLMPPQRVLAVDVQGNHVWTQNTDALPEEFSVRHWRFDDFLRWMEPAS